MSTTTTRSRPAANPTADAAHPLRAVGTMAAVIAIVLLGANLRLVFGSTSALLAEIRDGYQLSSGSAALLTTGPLVCLGVFGALAAGLVRKWTVPAVLTGCLALIALGTAIRGAPFWSAMLIGTMIAGAGIAVANVLGPVLVRLLFAHRIGLMTGVFTAVVSASAGIASGVTIPIDSAVFHNWRATLLAWAIPALVATAAIGLVAVRHHRFARTDGAGPAPTASWQPAVLRSTTAWAVTGFMGLQSLVAYATIAWLPTIYRERGASAEFAGLLLTALSLTSIITALTFPMLATRLRRQRLLALVAVSLPIVGLSGVITGGTGASMDWALVWAVILGLGQGAQLSLALTLINLRAASASMTTSLSTMAQSAGYVIAATGPIAAGALRSATGSWTPALTALLLLTIPLAICGWVAGRDRYIGQTAAQPAPTG